MRVLIAVAFVLYVSSVALAPAAAQDAGKVTALEAKLAALEQAFKAGILSQEEYARKKASLEASLRAARPALDAETVKKLKALDAALQAGILSREEYERKKVALLGAKGAPKTAVPKSGVELRRYADPDRRFQFLCPAGTAVRTLPKDMGASIMRGKGAVSVLCWPKITTGKDVASTFAGQLQGQWKDYREVKRVDGKLGGHPAVLIEFTGVNLENQPSHGVIAGVGVGGQGFSIARIGPDADYRALQPIWDAVVNSFAVGGVAASGNKGKLYRHTIGFSFWHPGGWTVKEHEDYLQIVPPDPSTNERGPEELYFIIGDTVEDEGITSADHPIVAHYLDESVRSALTPALQRTGGTKTCSTSKGKGVIYDWKARSPATGKTVLARAYALIIRNHGVALLAFGVEDKVTARDKALRRMFASFGFGEGKKDPRLVGAWVLESTHDIWNKSPFETPYTRARGYHQSKSRLTIRADGTWVRTDVWELLAMGGGTNPITGTAVMLESGPQKSVSQGRWCAGGGVFYRSFKDGSWCDEKYRFQKTAAGVKLVLEDEKVKEVWTRAGE